MPQPDYNWQLIDDINCIWRGTGNIYVINGTILEIPEDGTIVVSGSTLSLLPLHRTNRTFVGNVTIETIGGLNIGKGGALNVSGCVLLYGSVTVPIENAQDDRVLIATANCFILGTPEIHLSGANENGCSRKFVAGTETVEDSTGKLQLQAVLGVDTSTCQQDNAVQPYVLGVAIGVPLGLVVVTIVIVLAIPALRHKLIPVTKLDKEALPNQHAQL